MSTEEMADTAGEHGLTRQVNTFQQLLSLILAKYGMIGLVVAYFGFINWQLYQQIVEVTRTTTITISEQTAAVRELTKAIERLDRH